LVQGTNGVRNWNLGHTINGSAVNNLNASLLPTNPGKMYSLRVDVDVGVGSKMTLYVDGVQQIQMPDDQAALAVKGSVGLRQSVAATTATTGGRILSMNAQAPA
jgi:hypothetical protein